MITIPNISEFTTKLSEKIPTIRYTEIVVDDSQLVKDLNNISPEDNHLLYAVIPSMANSGSADTVVKESQMLLLVLEKCDSSQAHEDFLAVMAATQKTAGDIEKSMIADMQDHCGFMRWLDPASIEIDPVWGLASCNGWSIKFSLRSGI